MITGRLWQPTRRRRVRVELPVRQQAGPAGSRTLNLIPERRASAKAKKFGVFSDFFTFCTLVYLLEISAQNEHVGWHRVREAALIMHRDFKFHLM